MRTIHLLSGIFALGLALPAMAQAPAPVQSRANAQYTRVNGEVVSINEKETTLRAADGKVTTFQTGRVMIPHEVPASTIKTGDFVATTNITIDEKSGRATELRVFPPDSGRPDQGESYPMGAPNSTRIMTNAPVARVVQTPEGRVLTTRIPGGERTIILPDTVKVTGYKVVDVKTIKPGWHLQALLSPGPDGKLQPVQILMNENGAPPKPAPPPARANP